MQENKENKCVEAKLIVKSTSAERLMISSDERALKNVKNQISELLSHYCSSVIRNIHPNFNKDFPEIIPDQLKYVPPSKQSKKSSNSKDVKRRRLSDSSSTSTIINGPRKNRFSGSFKTLFDNEPIEEVQSTVETVKVKKECESKKKKKEEKVLPSSSSSSSSSSGSGSSSSSSDSSSDEETNAPSTQLKQRKPLILSDSSSDEEQVERNKKIQLKKHEISKSQPVTFGGKPMKALMATVQSSQKEMKTKVPVATSIPSMNMKPPNKPSSTNVNRTQSVPQPSTSKVKGVQNISRPEILKPIPSVQPKTVFKIPKITEMKKSSIAAKKPQLIEPPQTDPMVRKPTKPKKMNTNPEEESMKSLGGIFAIDNGWDKTPTQPTPPMKSKQEEQELRKLQQKKSPVMDYNFDIDEAHSVFQGFGEVDEESIGNPIISAKKSKISLKTAELISYKNNNQDIEMKTVEDHHTKEKFERGNTSDEDEESSDDEIKKTEDSEDDEEMKDSEVNGEVKEDDKSDKIDKKSNEKVQETSDNETSLNFDEDKKVEKDSEYEVNSDDEDAISLGCDDLDLDALDFEYDECPKKKTPKSKKKEGDIPPIMMTAELDELKMTIRPEKIPEVSEEEARRAFEENTAKIMQEMDPQTILINELFPNVCHDYLNEKICNNNCGMRHNLFKAEDLKKKLVFNQPAELAKIFEVVYKTSKLYESYFPMFLEIFIQHKMMTKIDQLIKGAEFKLHKDKDFFAKIHNALMVNLNWHKYEAAKYLFSKYDSKPITERAMLEVVLSLDFETIYFMNHIERWHKMNLISLQHFEKIMEISSQTQNPSLPTFILNFLLTRNCSEINILKRTPSYKKFIDYQSFLSELNEDREMKLRDVLRK